MHRGQTPRDRRPRQVGTARRRWNQRLRPDLHVLEARTLLAANVFPVTSLLDNGSAGTLRYEVQQAEQTAGASVVQFSSSLFANGAQTIALASGQIDLTDTQGALTIQGPGAGLLSISGGGTSRVFYQSGGTTTLDGLTITGGRAQTGGGIDEVGGSLTLTDSTISGNTAVGNSGANIGIPGGAGTGGGIAVSGSAHLSLSESTISGNAAIGGDSGYSATGGGGNGVGGGIAASASAVLTLSGSTIVGNSAEGGKGRGTTSPGGDGTGGGIAASGSVSLTLDGCTVSGNTAIGGAVDNVGSQGGRGTGGGIAAIGSASGSVSVLVSGSTISGNSAVGGSTIVNQAVGGLAIGGGFAVADGPGSVSLIDSTIVGNSAVGGSGNANGGLGDNAEGGGVAVASSSASLTLNACTIVGNTAVGGAGLTNGSQGGTATGDGVASLGSVPVLLDNTIVTDTVSGTLDPTSSYNLLVGTGTVGGLSGGTDGNLVGAFPLASIFAVDGNGNPILGNYGGPTQTIALAPGSPAIGAGSASVSDYSATDQRGMPRGAVVDIGAVQVSLVVETTSGAVDTTAGTLSLPGAVQLANTYPGAEITFDPAVFGSTNQTIALTGTMSLANLPLTTTITGPSNVGVTLQGNGSFGIFSFNAAPVSLSWLTIKGGGSVEEGGGINNQQSSSHLTLTDCIISDNSAAYGGGALYTYSGTVGLTNCTISDNSSAHYGGAINLYTGTVKLTGSTISGSSSADEGGAIYVNRGTVELTDSTISGNSASDRGGAIYAKGGTVDLTGSTISGNSASESGGAIYENFGILDLTDSTISGNSSAFDGGAIYGFFGNMDLTDSTISGNSARSGGGLCSEFGSIGLSDTIVAGNLAGGSPSDIVNRFGSLGGQNNLIGDPGSSGGLTNGVDGNIVGTATGGVIPIASIFAVDGKGQPILGNYGGPTQTIALVPGSPAIDAGSTTVPGYTTTDQRGFARLGAPDIGAFESQGFTISAVSGGGQSTTLGQPFASPLTVSVTANDPNLVLNNGTITFTAPSTGASAVLSAGGATGATIAAPIAGGKASVNASAGSSTVGTFEVIASVPEGNPVSFDLTDQQATTTSLTLPAYVVPGQVVDYVAKVTPSLSGTPTGSVQFYLNGTPDGSPIPLSASGTATLAYDPTSPGAFTVQAVYLGDKLDAGSSSTIANQTVLGTGAHVVGSTLVVVGSSGADKVFLYNASVPGHDDSTILTLWANLGGTDVKQTFATPPTAFAFYGYQGNDTIAFGPGVNLPATVVEGDGSDNISLGNGNNTVTLGNGNDTVSLGTGNNVVVAGDGNDNIQAGGWSNSFGWGFGDWGFGGGWSDGIGWGFGNGWGWSDGNGWGQGNDSQSTSAGSNLITLGNGRDNVTLGNGDNKVTVGDGRDNVVLGTGNNVVVAGNGNDEIQIGGGWSDGNGWGDGHNSQSTSVGSNIITVGNGNDTIALGNGNDQVNLGGGNDTVIGGDGNKTITTLSTGTGPANDQVFLGDGNNTVTLSNGNDRVFLGDGNNLVTVGNGNDEVNVGDGNNVVVEGNGDDSITAGNGNNLLVGGLGRHTIRAGKGNNILIDGSVQLTSASDTLEQVLTSWIQDIETSAGSASALAADVASIRTRIQVTYNTTNANTLRAGKGLDWFWFVNPKDRANVRPGDLTN